MPATVRHTADSIRQLLLTNDRAVLRGLVRLYERQTQDEKATSNARHRNSRGFNHATPSG